MNQASEFEYRGHEVVVATVCVDGRWRWSYEIDTGLPATTMSEAYDDEVAANDAAARDARRRIDAMHK